MDENFPDMELGLDDLAAARAGAWADAAQIDWPKVAWFNWTRPDGSASPAIHVQDVRILIKVRDDQRAVIDNLMALMHKLDTELIDALLALPEAEDEDGTKWVKLIDVRAAMAAVADKE